MPFADLTGRTALITGGSRGIGKAIARMLMDHGADIIIHGSNPETLAAASKDLGGVRTIVADLFNPASIETIVTEAGHVDILVNNAGITRDNLFLRMKAEQWSEVLTVDLERAVQLTRAVLPGMYKKGFGRVINITSVIAHTGNIGQANYAAAKAGLTGFTKAVAKEVARKDVTVNAVAPGFIATEMTDTLTEAAKDAIAQAIPAQRLGTVTDVAAAVAFLASHEAGYITGSTLHVNGGMYV